PPAQPAPPTAQSPVTPPPAGSVLPPPGSPVTPPPGGVLPPPTTFAAPPQSTGRGSKTGLWIVLGVLVALLLFSGVGIGVWALTKGDDEKESTTDSETTDDDESDDPTEEPGDLDCDDLDDLSEAVADLNYWWPGEDQDTFDDAVAVIEDFEDHGDEDLADWADTWLEYADTLENWTDDPSEVWDSPESEASDAAQYDLDDLIYDEC
ncbi:MAG: hypothetical protein QM621_08305, partial [Aeromicrobium sp.]